jgi:hypothetical protein
MPSVVFELRRSDTGGLVRRYATEGAALAFVRDVIRVAGREPAAGFVLEERDERNQTRFIAVGPELVQRAFGGPSRVALKRTTEACARRSPFWRRNER